MASLAGMEGTHDPSQMRISDADRHKVAEVLRDAAGEGRLDLEELDERLEATYSAKVYADLVPIVADLPGHTTSVPAVRPGASPVRQPPADAPHYSTSLALMSEQKRHGVWVVGHGHQAVAIMGGIEIDLREAVFTEPEAVITANALMAGIDIIVNPWTRVQVDGIGVMGEYRQGRDRVPAELGPDSPLVRVRGLALMGGVKVVRKAMPGESRRTPRGHIGH